MGFGRIGCMGDVLAYGRRALVRDMVLRGVVGIASRGTQDRRIDGCWRRPPYALFSAASLSWVDGHGGVCWWRNNNLPGRWGWRCTGGGAIGVVDRRCICGGGGGYTYSCSITLRQILLLLPKRNRVTMCLSCCWPGMRFRMTDWWRG